MDTRHYSDDRAARAAFIRGVIGYGRDIYSVEIDRGHRDGTEIHTVTDSGIIKIFNAVTGRHITDLIARPSQIIRTFHAGGQYAPQWLVDIAREHQTRGYNYA